MVKIRPRPPHCQSQWPRGLRRRYTAARLLRSWVRIPPRAWMFVCCECFVLSGRGLCDGLIIRSEESYRLWRVVVCDQETSQARRLKPTRDRLIVVVSKSYIIRHRHRVGILWTNDPPVAEAPIYTMHNTHDRRTSFCGIRTHNPSSRLAAELHLRPQSHTYQSLSYITPFISPHKIQFKFTIPLSLRHTHTHARTLY